MAGWSLVDLDQSIAHQTCTGQPRSAHSLARRTSRTSAPESEPPKRMKPSTGVPLADLVFAELEVSEEVMVIDATPPNPAGLGNVPMLRDSQERDPSMRGEAADHRHKADYSWSSLSTGGAWAAASAAGSSPEDSAIRAA